MQYDRLVWNTKKTAHVGRAIWPFQHGQLLPVNKFPSNGYAKDLCR